MSFLTGKPATQTSENVNRGLINSTYAPQMQQGVGANNFMAQLLGLQGGGQANQAYDQFKNASGYQNIFNEAMRGTTNSAAGRGLLGSGSTARALQTNAGNLAQGSFGNFLQQLQGLSGQGLQAGSLVSGAGQRSSSTAGSSGLLGALGAALPLIPGIGTAASIGLGALGGLGGGGSLSTPTPAFAGNNWSPLSFGS